jgi:hypothetical protein
MNYEIKSNQYGFPCKTYWYIVDGEGKIYHYSDKKFRKKSLKQLLTYAYFYYQAALEAVEMLENQPRNRKQNNEYNKNRFRKS